MGQVLLASMSQFRYRGDSIWTTGASGDTDFYTNNVTSDTDSGLWKISNLIKNYSKIVIYGAGFILQILAIFGIAQTINDKFWVYGVFVESISIDLIYTLIAGYAAQKISYAARGTSTTTAGLVWAASKITLELLVFFGLEAVTYTALSSHWGPWMQGNEPGPETEEEEEEEEVVEEATEEGAEEGAEGEAVEGGEEAVEVTADEAA